MIWLAGAFIFAAMAAVDVWTFWTIGYLPSPRPWRIISGGLLTIGIAVGMWLGCFCTYQVTPDLRYIGFPVPGLVLQLEDGRWIDYVGLIPVVLPFNVFTIVSCFLPPISLGLVVRRLAVGPLPRPSALR
jgi:hypothetical protein